jgi:hypothetical protein
MHGLLVDAFIPSASAIYDVDRQLELFEAVVGPAYFAAVGLEASRAACRAVGPRATFAILMNIFSTCFVAGRWVTWDGDLPGGLGDEVVVAMRLSGLSSRASTSSRRTWTGYRSSRLHSPAPRYATTPVAPK